MKPNRTFIKWGVFTETNKFHSKNRFIAVEGFPISIVSFGENRI